MQVDYSKSILQVSSSLFHFSGLENEYETDPAVTRWINDHGFTQVIALLVDAMGKKILEDYLPKESFLRQHILEDVSTVFPPTTSAATTSFLTGKSPAENGWLGWNQYFSQKEDNIILFKECAQYHEKQYPGFISTVLPTTTIVEKLKDQGETLMPAFAPGGCQTFEEMCERIVQESQKGSKKFVYAYWDALDSLMHKVGPSDPSVQKMLEEINDCLEKTVKQLSPKTGLLILADHGHIDVRCHDLEEDQDLMDCLRHLPALEARTIAFYLKPGKEEEFDQIFQKRYGKDYELYTHQQVLEMGLFGPGIPQAQFEEFIGDRLAIATGDLCLGYHIISFKGQHAGGTKAESQVSIVVYPKGEQE